MTQMPTIPLPARLLKVAIAPAAVGLEPSAQQLAQAGARLLEQNRQQLASAAAALQEGLTQLAQLKSQTIHAAEGQLVELAMNIASRVLMQEIKAGRYEIDPIVQEALASVSAHQNVTVRLHPDDLSRCSLATAAADGGPSFVADPSIARAHCRIETPEGTVESDIDSHLRAIGEEFRGGQA